MVHREIWFKFCKFRGSKNLRREITSVRAGSTRSRKGSYQIMCKKLSFQEVIKALRRIGSSQLARQVTSELKNLKIPAHMGKIHPLLDDKGIHRLGGG